MYEHHLNRKERAAISTSPTLASSDTSSETDSINAKDHRRRRPHTLDNVEPKAFERCRCFKGPLWELAIETLWALMICSVDCLDPL